MGSRQLLLSCISMLLSAPNVTAASRLEDLAGRLASQASALAAESYRGFVRRDSGTRADVEVLYLVQQLGAGADLFRDMVADRRPESELRDSLVILNDLLSAAQRYSFGRRQLQDMQRGLDDLSRELNVGRSGRADRDPAVGAKGRMRWRGAVDDEIQIFVQSSEATAHVITGNSLGQGTSTFTSGLPRRSVTVILANTKGRGQVEIIQQPSPDNDFTAVVRIRDPKGGSSNYEFEIVW